MPDARWVAAKNSGSLSSSARTELVAKSEFVPITRLMAEGSELCGEFGWPAPSGMEIKGIIFQASSGRVRVNFRLES